MKRTIKVRFLAQSLNTKENCFGAVVGKQKLFIKDVLKKQYILDEKSEPDYVFTFVPVGGAKGYEYGKYKDAVVIFIQLENVFPDFYCYDYAIGSDHMLHYKDRYFYLDCMFSADPAIRAFPLIAKKHLDISDDYARRKFCAITAGNFMRAARQREDMMTLLSSYKRVDSGGKSKNNVGGPVKNKVEFEGNHKFVIAFDNVENGFVQEKIGMAFAAKTVPIYWGNPNVTDLYNSRAFINCHDYRSFDEVLDRVRELDQDDQKYLDMLKEPAVLNEKTIDVWERELLSFLMRIIEQPKECAIKRRNEMWSGTMQEMRIEGFKNLYRREQLEAAKGKALQAAYKPLRNLKMAQRTKEVLLDHFRKEELNKRNQNYYGGGQGI